MLNNIRTLMDLLMVNDKTRFGHHDEKISIKQLC